MTSYGYDTLDRLKSLVTKKNTTTLGGFSYTLRPEGNRSQVVEQFGASTRTVNYSYDNAYRLLSETISLGSPSGTISYTYDAVGNRTSRTSSVAGIATVASYTYDTNDRLNGNSYDNNGNTMVAGSVTYAYDFANRLTSTNGGVSIAYDGDGNRVSETLSGTTTHYLVDDLNPTGYPQVVEEISGGTVLRTYTYGHALISQNRWTGSTWVPSFYGDDGLGSVRFLADAAGTKTDSYDYDAFGSLIASSTPTPNSYRFTGEQFDANLGLYYLRARYYNTGIGRFWSRDTAAVDLTDPRELNRYVYVADNPVNAVDPSGLFGVAGYVGTLKPSIRALPGLLATGLAVACVYRLTTSILATALEIATLGGTLKFSNLTDPCGVEREEKKTCDSPEFSGYVRCSAIRGRYYFDDLQQAVSIGRVLANNPLADKYNPKPSEEGVCPSKNGQHWEFRARPGGYYYTSIVECPCCDDSGDTPSIKRRCGYFGDHDPIFKNYRR